MTKIYNQKKEQFKKLFQENRPDHFENRYKILEVFLQTEQHVTASEFSRLLDERKISFDQAFVKDTLNIMCRFGFAHKTGSMTASCAMNTGIWAIIMII